MIISRESSIPTTVPRVSKGGKEDPLQTADLVLSGSSYWRISSYYGE